MDVVVVGGGIVGLASAWYLQRAGHAVTLVEARDGVGLGTSFANGGQLSYRYIAPLADPEVLAKIPAWMLRSDAPVRFRPAFDPAQWRWIASFLQACNRRASSYSVATLLPLSLYSRGLVAELAADPRFDFDWRRNGKLVLHRQRGSFEAARRLLEREPELASQQQALNAEQCVALEPSLARIGRDIAGAIHTPGEEVGDCFALCRAFARALSESARPVHFLLAERAERIEAAGGRFAALLTDRRRIRADACVIASGVRAGALLRPLGIDVPLYPLKGYSISPRVRSEHGVPALSVTDFQRKIVYARLGGRLRVAGMADIVGYDESLRPARIATLKREVAAHFGAALDLDDLAPWAGLRPATPTGRPIVGESSLRGLWLNLGHGALGFTLAAGCGRLLAERLAGREAPVPDEAFLPPLAARGWTAA